MNKHRYYQIREELEGLDYDKTALAQYLTISQMMLEEEKAYKQHKAKMNQWLKNIENTIYKSVNSINRD